MKSKDVKDIVRTAVLLFLICAVSAGILAAVNSVTAPKIAEASVAAAEKSKAEVLPGAVSFEELTLEDGSVCWAGKAEDGSILGYVFNTSASSYGGKVQLMTGIGADGAVTGISILAINDTPGLGMNAKKPDWQQQFTGTNGELTVVKGGGAGENEINAMTSATITSKAVTACVNAAREGFNEITAKEGE